MMNYEAQDEVQEIGASAARRQPITVTRVTNLSLVLLYGAVLIVHIVCLAVMAAKRNEIVGKFEDDEFYKYYNIKESCMLFVDYDGIDSDNSLPQIKWVNNKCHVVIYGSGALGGCALLMIVFLILRTIVFRKINLLVLLDAIEVVLTGLFAGVLAVIITLGKNKTCKSIEKFTSDVGFPESCEDFYFSSVTSTPSRSAQIYEALRIAQVTSWIAVGIIGMIGMITMMRLLLWLGSTSCRRGSVELNPPLVVNDQLAGDDQLRNDDLNHGYNYEDDKPLYP